MWPVNTPVYMSFQPFSKISDVLTLVCEQFAMFLFFRVRKRLAGLQFGDQLALAVVNILLLQAMCP